MAEGKRCRLGTVSSTDFGQNVPDVAGDGVLTDEQRFRNVTVAPARGDQV